MSCSFFWVARKIRARKCLRRDSINQRGQSEKPDLIHYCDCCLFYYTINLFMARNITWVVGERSARLFSLSRPNLRFFVELKNYLSMQLTPLFITVLRVECFKQLLNKSTFTLTCQSAISLEHPLDVCFRTLKCV